MRIKTMLSLAATLALGATAADADARIARAGDANVAFTATGPGGLKIVGTTSELVVNDGGGDSITVIVPLRNLDTKIELRNKHMREKYLHVDKFPNAEIVVPRSEVRAPTNGEISADGTGTMKLHGRERPVRFHYTAKRGPDRVLVSATLRLNIKDFGIEEPSFMGASVKPDVDVAANFGVVDQ